VKVRKGALVAFESVERTLEKLDPAKPSVVIQLRTWRLGTVDQATRDGKVKRIDCGGVKLPMVKRHFDVYDIKAIPRDLVYADAMLDEAAGKAWKTLPEIERFVAEYVRHEAVDNSGTTRGTARGNARREPGAGTAA
jgi:hypothetical protein